MPTKHKMKHPDSTCLCLSLAVKNSSTDLIILLCIISNTKSWNAYKCWLSKYSFLFERSSIPLLLPLCFFVEKKFSLSMNVVFHLYYHLVFWLGNGIPNSLFLNPMNWLFFDKHRWKGPILREFYTLLDWNNISLRDALN